MCFTRIDSVTAGALARVLGVMTALLLPVGDALAGELFARVVTADGKPVGYTVITIEALDQSSVSKDRNLKKFTVDQVDKEFFGRVTVVPRGAEVWFPNHDNIRHHVYSFSPAKVFELPLYTGTPAEPVIFDRAGVVKLGCNIHDWMVGYVYVTDADYFATTDVVDGEAMFTGLPAGRYLATAWHPQMTASEEKTRREVTVEDTGRSEVLWEIDLKPDLRPRRAPIRGGGGYR